MHSQSNSKIKRRIGFHKGAALPVVALAFLFLFTMAHSATISVTNNGDLVNGDTTSPEALFANPGQDGISLPEAMRAAISVSGPHTIIFDPSLKESTIILTSWLPNLNSSLITIDGDIDTDGEPDITIDGSGSTSSVGFRVLASDITIKGLAILNFTSVGIQVFADNAQGWPLIERVTIQGNRVSAGWAGISIYNWGHNCTIRDIVIKGNELKDNGARGIEISAALGPSMHNNQITSVKITANSISNIPGDNKIAIFITGASDQASTNNLISAVDIVENTITGHTFANLQISAGNERNCLDNRIENLLIERNMIEGSPVTMEFLGGVGIGALRNWISDMSIVKNNLIGGGIQLVGAQGGDADQNGIEIVHIGQNSISGAAANGIFIIAGSDGAAYNTVTGTTIENNIITDNADAGILLHGAGNRTPNNLIENVVILNNTIVENGNEWAGGININSNSSTNIITGVKIINTILWNNAGNDVVRGSLTPDVVNCSILNDPRFIGINGNFYSFPSFADLNQKDFHIQKNSPCIDKGDSQTETLPDYDFEGDSRILDGDRDGLAMVDIGADEYNGVKMQRAMPYMLPLLLDNK
jgi:hypothetical protein